MSRLLIHRDRVSSSPTAVVQTLLLSLKVVIIKSKEKDEQETHSQLTSGARAGAHLHVLRARRGERLFCKGMKPEGRAWGWPEDGLSRAEL